MDTLSLISSQATKGKERNISVRVLLEDIFRNVIFKI